MITAATSNSTEVAEELLSYFVDIGNKECFAAMLYVAFDLLHSDVIEELSWRHGLNDFYMPYRIQMQRSLVEKVSFDFLLMLLVSYFMHVVGPIGERGKGTLKKGGAKRAEGIRSSYHQPRWLWSGTTSNKWYSWASSTSSERRNDACKFRIDLFW